MGKTRKLRAARRCAALGLALGAVLGGLSGCVASAASSPAATTTTSAGPSTAQAPTTSGAAGGVLAAGSPHSVSLEVDGLSRTFVLFRPTSAPPGAPLVVFLHGSKGSGARFEAQVGFDQLAAAKGIVVAYPDALPPAHGWHVQCCTTLAESPVDLDFIRALIVYLRQAGVTGPQRAVVAGFSSGAMMALDVACKLSSLVGAVVPLSGALFVVPRFVRTGLPAAQQCAPTRPVTIMAFNGTADTNVPLTGWHLCQASGEASPTSQSGPATPVCGPGDPGFEAPLATWVDWWARLNHCSGATTSPPVKVHGGLIVATEPGCPAGGTVTSVRVVGAGHSVDEILSAYAIPATVARLALAAAP